jgi:hypothetical protein
MILGKFGEIGELIFDIELPAAMRYILKAERDDRRGVRKKTILHNSRKRCIELKS